MHLRGVLGRTRADPALGSRRHQLVTDAVQPPDTGYFYVPGTIRTSVVERFPRQYRPRNIYTSGSQEAAFHTLLAGTFIAIDSNTNKIAWQHKMPYRMGSGSGSSVTASPDISKGVGASGRWI